MLALSSQLHRLRTSRKQIAGKIEAIKRQVQFENRPNSQYTASGLKRNRDEKEDDKSRRSSLRPDDLPEVSEPVLKKPKISSIAAQVQPEPDQSDNSPGLGLDAQPSAADTEMTDSAAADNNLVQPTPKKRSRQTDIIRNRRMFGALLGHLNKAKENITDEQQAEKAQRRATLEQHVQERIQNDTAQIRDEKLKQLNEEMEREQTNLNETMEKLIQTENKMKAARLVDRHVRNAGLIQTSTQPFIFWKPRLHTSRTKNMLLRSRKKTKEALRETIAKWGFNSVEEFEDLLKEKKPSESNANKVSNKRDKDDGEGGEDRSSQDEDMRDKGNEEQGEAVDQEPAANHTVEEQPEEQQPADNTEPTDPVEEETNKEGVVVVVGEVEANDMTGMDEPEA